MGYSFYIISKEKPISKEDFDTAMANLSKFNREGMDGHPPCDINFSNKYIRISGSFGISGQYAEGFVLNMLICLMDLAYSPRILSGDWEYGTEEDFEWLNSKEQFLRRGQNTIHNHKQHL